MSGTLGADGLMIMEMYAYIAIPCNVHVSSFFFPRKFSLRSRVTSHFSKGKDVLVINLHVVRQLYKEVISSRQLRFMVCLCLQVASITLVFCLTELEIIQKKI